ncbi:MAG: hypothetical protein AB7V48_10735 [Sedimentibacter sp.]
MSDINNFKDQMLYEVQKAFYDERGKGARYRLTLTGVPYIKSQLGEKANDIEELKNWLVDNKFCEEIEIEQDEIEFKAKMKNCCLHNISNSFYEKGMQPLSCPIANMFMSAIESELGLSPELLPIDISGEYCGIICAKIADSAVVEGN